jgi:hypothetical protein
LKPGAFKLWVNNWIQLVQPHLGVHEREGLERARGGQHARRAVAVQVGFESRKICETHNTQEITSYMG